MPGDTSATFNFNLFSPIFNDLKLYSLILCPRMLYISISAVFVFSDFSINSIKFPFIGFCFIWRFTGYEMVASSSSSTPTPRN